MSLKIALAYVVLLTGCFFISSNWGIQARSNQNCYTPHCGFKNLACNNKGNFSINCPSGSKLVNLRPHKGRLLYMFNTFRSKVAVGYTPTLFPAGRMARMDWSTELENFARMYVYKCLPDPRPCMASNRYTVIGSIYDGLTYTGNPNQHKVPEILEELLNGWFEDARYVTRKLSLSLTDEFQKPSVRQSVLLMADRNSHVGCSALKFSEGMVNQFRLACAFATDNMIYKPIYKIHAVAGKLCKKRDKTFRNLCAIGEPYNNRHAYKLGEVIEAAQEFSGQIS